MTYVCTREEVTKNRYKFINLKFYVISLFLNLIKYIRNNCFLPICLMIKLKTLFRLDKKKDWGMKTVTIYSF